MAAVAVVGNVHGLIDALLAARPWNPMPTMPVPWSRHGPDAVSTSRRVPPWHTAAWRAWVAGALMLPVSAANAQETRLSDIPAPILQGAETLPGVSADSPLIHSLPPTTPQGPVVLDIPYEAAPDLPDERVVPGTGFPEGFDDLWARRPWFWQILPNNLIYTSYLAGPKEPRLASVWYDDSAPDPFDPKIKNGWMWDMTVGGRVSILRYGSDTVVHPQGFEVQVEGAAFVRLDQGDQIDLRSSDYRFGLPLVYGVGRWQTKLGYYHLSAHLGDEAMLKHRTFPRVNYLRDAMVWGNSYYLFDWMRIYGDIGYSFNNDGGSEPWEFQYGTELIQARPTGLHGGPFLAINGMSRQELDWGGNICVQTGWAWRGRRSERLLRIGFEYLNGADPQYEFVFYNQNRAGIGLWYDY